MSALYVQTHQSGLKKKKTFMIKSEIHDLFQ